MWRSRRGSGPDDWRDFHLADLFLAAGRDGGRMSSCRPSDRWRCRRARTPQPRRKEKELPEQTQFGFDDLKRILVDRVGLPEEDVKDDPRHDVRRDGPRLAGLRRDPARDGAGVRLHDRRRGRRADPHRRRGDRLRATADWPRRSSGDGRPHRQRRRDQSAARVRLGADDGHRELAQPVQRVRQGRGHRAGRRHASASASPRIRIPTTTGKVWSWTSERIGGSGRRTARSRAGSRPGRSST